MKRPIAVCAVYAEQDEALQRALEKHLALLQRQGVISTWQQRLAGARWQEERAQALSDASLILLLVSADVLASDACYEEQMQQALERQRRGAVQVVPILLRPVALMNAPFASLPMVPTNGKTVTEWSNQDAAWAHITEGIRCVLEGKPLPIGEEERPEATYHIENQQAVQGQVMGEHATVHQHYYPPPNLAPVPVPAPARVWMVPYARNPFFTGREDLLTQLQAHFQQQQAMALSQPQAMSGLGGIGKTQMAVEYAHRHAKEYEAVLWVRAETQENLVSGYVEMAQELELRERDEQEQAIVVQAVKRWLTTTERSWLLILDNADCPER
jgi:hypothetical protein